ncbi:MAG: patatin-like phospholipase family protein [Acidobacteriota bacterium]
MASPKGVTIPPPNAADARIGIITVLDHEYQAMKALLADVDELVVPGFGAGRRYIVGSVPTKHGSHSVLLAMGTMGNNGAAIRATRLLDHFPDVEDILIVGIAGGVPSQAQASPDQQVHLGDVVVSNDRGVVHYDFGKELPDGSLEIRDVPRPPSAVLLEASRLLAQTPDAPWRALLPRVLMALNATRPSAATDPYAHIGPDPEHPRVFHGAIAAADRVLTNPNRRDVLRDRYRIKAIEMETSGIAEATWNSAKGYLTIRGICDYCDGSKNDVWQPYAAAAAAAYAAALISTLPSPAPEHNTASSSAPVGIVPPETHGHAAPPLLATAADIDLFTRHGALNHYARFFEAHDAPTGPGLSGPISHNVRVGLRILGWETSHPGDRYDAELAKVVFRFQERHTHPAPDGQVGPATARLLVRELLKQFGPAIFGRLKEPSQEGPRVVVREGNILDVGQFCDLVVLPCSATGTFTGWTANHIAHLELAAPHDKPPTIAPGGTTEPISVSWPGPTRYVVFASSVIHDESSPAVLRSIGECLGRLTHRNDFRPALRVVEAPLLGTGAGGMPPGPAVAHLAAGFLAAACPGSQLRIVVQGSTQVAGLQAVLQKGEQSPAHGRALVMKGGGIKGLALAGAVMELQSHYTFTIYVGTSAGAIVAALLAGGYDGSDLVRILMRTDFASLVNGPLKGLLLLLRFHYFDDGCRLRDWLCTLLREKGIADGAKLHELPRRAILYATTAEGVLVFDSDKTAGHNNSTRIDHAVRCSMSIPYFFRRESHDGIPVLDGGLLANYPVREFLLRHPGYPFVGIYLETPRQPAYHPRSTLSHIYSAWNSQSELREVEARKESTVVVDPAPLSTTSFRLTDVEKEHLVLQGRLAALTHLLACASASDRDLRTRRDEVQLKAEEVRQRVYAVRQRRRQTRWLVALAGVLAVIVGGLMMRSRGPSVPPRASGAKTTPLTARHQSSPLDPSHRSEHSDDGEIQRPGDTSAPGDTQDESVEVYAWQPLSAGSGPDRRIAEGVYDSNRRTLVVFGGQGPDHGHEGPYYSDTWEYDGTSWKMIVSASGVVPARYAPAFAFDSNSGLAMMFGGLHGDKLNDTWMYDGRTWLPVESSPRPPARYEHSMIFDKRRGRFVLFGGMGVESALNDTWEFLDEGWAKRPAPPQGLTPRFGQAMVWDEGRARAMLFGGQDQVADDSENEKLRALGERPTATPRLRSRFVGDMWAYDGQAWAPVEMPARSPEARMYHSMAYDSRRDRVVVIGGSGEGGYVADIWIEAEGIWMRNSLPEGLTARNGPIVAYDDSRDVLILFGGFDVSGEYRSDLWRGVPARLPITLGN